MANLSTVYGLSLVAGTIAAFIAAYGGNKLHTINQEPAPEPVPESEPDTEPETAAEPEPDTEPEVETATEPEPEPEPSTAVAPSIMNEDTVSDMAGGGFGRPSWTPLNATTATAMQGSLISKVSGTYKRTVRDIQKDLKDNDDQIRVLKTQKFLQTQSVKTFTDQYNQARKNYVNALTNKTKYEKLTKYYDDEINKLLNPRPSNELYLDILKRLLPDNPTDKKWKEYAFEELKQNKEKYKSIVPEDILPKDSDDLDKWNGRIKDKRSQSISQPQNIEGKLRALLETKSANTVSFEDSKEKEESEKENYSNDLQSLKDSKVKLSKIETSIKELNQTREVILTELSAYQLPKGLFEVTKQPPQKVYNLPTGQELTKLLKDLSDKSKEISEIDKRINDHVSKSLQTDGTLTKPDQETYGKLSSERAKLVLERDALISKIEGRDSDAITKPFNSVPHNEELQDTVKTLIPDWLSSKPIDRNQFLLKNICPKLIKQWNVELKKFIQILELVKNRNKTEKEVKNLETATETYLRTNPNPNNKIKDAYTKQIEIPLSQKKDLLNYINQYDLEEVKSNIKLLQEKIKNCPKYAEEYIKTLQGQQQEEISYSEVNPNTDTPQETPQETPPAPPPEIVPQNELTTQQNNTPFRFSPSVEAAFSENELIPTGTNTSPQRLSEEQLDRSGIGGSHHTRKHSVRSKPKRSRTQRT